MSRLPAHKQWQAAAIADGRALRLLPPGVRVRPQDDQWFDDAEADRLAAPMARASQPGYWQRERERQIADWHRRKGAA